MTESKTMRKRGLSRASLIGLFALFFVPVLLAYWLNLGTPGWIPAGRTNHGELVRPARLLSAQGLAADALPAQFLREHWTLLYAAPPGQCDARCARALVSMRQARLALGKDMGRVDRLLVLSGESAAAEPELLAQHPGLHMARAAASWLEQLPSGPGFVYLVDPQGYLMMRYDDVEDATGMLKDMKRLLKLSKIG